MKPSHRKGLLAALLELAVGAVALVTIGVTGFDGKLLVLGGLAVLWGPSWQTAKLGLLVVILWVTNPVSSHLIARMELITGRDLDPDKLTGEGEREL